VTTAERLETGDRIELEALTYEALVAVQRVFDSYVVFPGVEARDAVALWVLHTWVFREFETTPRLSVRSSEYGSGKSLVLELISEIALNPLMAINLTPGVMWRMLDGGDVTILYDEVDTIFGKRGSSTAYQERRAIINAGHRANGKVPRCVGSEDVKNFNVFAPMALAGVGRLPESIASRSVEVVMRRRRAGDREIKPFRLKFARDALGRAKRLCERWADKAAFELRLSMPELPECIDNRKADVWEPLIAIADLAGSEWALRAREAAVVLTKEADEEPASVGVQLLTHLWSIFADHESRWTHELLGGLHSMEEGPWTSRNMTPRTLARVLGEYGIEPVMIRRGDRTARGYYRDDFTQPWSWYVDSEGVTDVTDTVGVES
jgi:hypothetical protein